MTQNRQLRSLFENKTLMMVVGTVLTMGVTVSGHLSLQPSIQETKIAQNYAELVTPATFDRIKIHATLAETRSAIGAPGDEISSSEKASTYRWGKLEGPYIVCEFKDGLLVHKARHNF